MIRPRTTSVAEEPRREGLFDAADALVNAALADPSSFGLLYERYYERVYRYCRVRTSSHDDAADLAQQVFVQALAGLRKYRPSGSGFAAWLFRIARNLAVDASRRRKHAPVL